MLVKGSRKPLNVSGQKTAGERKEGLRWNMNLSKGWPDGKVGNK